MSEAMTTITLASFGLVACAMAVFAALRGWQGWLELRRLELAGTSAARREPRGPAADLIEMADLKERIRKLEAIASCVDL